MAQHTDTMKQILLLATICVACLSACTQKNSDISTAQKDAAATMGKTTSMPTLAPVAQPDQYWYQGKAELATYDVEQERYGQMRPAEQVMIFVSEDLSRSKHVKLDDPQKAGTDAVKVLKINTLRRFKTGIYDYSLMQSVFRPMDGSPTLKTTTSVQDWCGHVFTQCNYDAAKRQYRTRDLSYFESEGDADQMVAADMLEDEIWTSIRLDPNKIPKGRQMVAPGAFYTRMRHQPHTAQPATITVEEGKQERTVTLKYEQLDRQITLVTEAAAPYRLLRWEERTKGQVMSKGTLKALRLEPYWQQNSHQFDSMRDSLMLKM
jgi:hypothetical protein